ncbi:alpha/beta fold hydrolase [Tomitella fengzijianii]|uniref:Alpha/beta fold hydrolase n=1 Tax=Tomitella fengzijianii TaxID=2597660 RepID=A0A516X8K8_9ACTN|nr:alpha/beta fold hydrolase [Tomitella fengzijianii]QDQ99363.1 alpha/beta fold hydrolase [Tomitella fengzijianii]
MHLHRFGPTRRTPDVLALHGLTGHGRRWASLARTWLPDLAVLAPDLRGHGRSPWGPPWTVDAQVRDLAATLREEGAEPLVVVGHSYGANIAVRLARAHPAAVRALVLLDPAMGLEPDRAREIADAYLHSPDYPDAATARADKLHGGWADVDPAVLDADIAEHLVASPFGGVTWRVCAPAMVAAWAEMALPAVPPPAVPTDLVRATRVQPPFLADQVVDQWHAQLGGLLTVHAVDCEHMVSQSHPELVAKLVRRALEPED